VTDLHAGTRFDDLRALIDTWLDAFAADNPLVLAIDRGTSDDTRFGEPRWYVRMRGDDKDVITVRRSNHPLHLITLPDRHYFDVLKSKLRWGGGRV